MYGPPGTGKTLLAAACASLGAATFLPVSSADMVSKWQGDSEKNVRALFAQARASAPSIIFIDEVDAVCCARTAGENDATRRLKSELLVQMDGVGGSTGGPRVFVMGATNKPHDLDDGFRRRFEQRVYVPLPDAAARECVLRKRLGSATLTDEQYVSLAARCEGFSGADVAILANKTAMMSVDALLAAEFFVPVGDGLVAGAPCRECPGAGTCPACGAIRATLASGTVPPSRLIDPGVTYADAEAALAACSSSVDPASLAAYDEWTRQFGAVG